MRITNALKQQVTAFHIQRILGLDIDEDRGVIQAASKEIEVVNDVRRLREKKKDCTKYDISPVFITIRPDTMLEIIKYSRVINHVIFTVVNYKGKKEKKNSMS